MGAQDLFLGPRRVIFGEPRDVLKQFGSALVIEPARRDRLLRFRQAGQDIAPERIVDPRLILVNDAQRLLNRHGTLPRCLVPIAGR